MKLKSAIATLTSIAATVRTVAAADRLCATADECDSRRKELDIDFFYSEDAYPDLTYKSKGCFFKNDKAYFSLGSTAEMEETNLPGVQERIWCSDDDSVGEIRSAVDSSDRPCATADECDSRRKELEIDFFYPEDAYPDLTYTAKGCFFKNNKAYFSLGSTAEMEDTNLPGVQERIWCSGEIRSSEAFLEVDSSAPAVMYSRLLNIGVSAAVAVLALPHLF